MRFRNWFTRGGAAQEDPRLRRWRESWTNVEPTARQHDIGRLARELEQIALPDEEVEIEREMLQALIDREELASATRASGLPRLKTGHRVVRDEPCHYSAPVSLIEDSAQPTGR